MTEFTVGAQFHPRHGWITIALTLDGIFGLDMALSAREHTIVRWDLLETLPHLFHSIGPGSYEMLRVTLGEQQIGNLAVQPSQVVRRLGIDGMLGMDFLLRFTDVHLNVRAHRLTFLGP